MAAYLLFSMPLVVLISAALARSTDTRAQAFTDSPASIVGGFIPGLIVSVVALLILSGIGPALEGSYRPGRMYFGTLLEEYLIPLAVAALGVVGLNAVKFPGWESRPSFAVALAYLGGYFTVLAVAEFLASRTEPTAHVMFLAPTLRIVVAVVYARAMERLSEGGRRPGWITIAVMVALPLVLTMEGYWTRLGRDGAALMLTAGLAVLTFLGLFLRAGGGRAARPAGA